MAAAFYERNDAPPPSGFFAALVSELESRVVEVWPENWPAFRLFSSLTTQWRTAGMTGAYVGLDYNVLHRELDDLGLTGEERQQMKDDIRVMEREALRVMREQN